MLASSSACSRARLLTHHICPPSSTVEVWLRQALEWLGAGAKTAVGYGRFTGRSQAAGHPPAARATAYGNAVRQEPARRPRYKSGDRVGVKRVEDPKGKGRLWFEADDGFGGTLTPKLPQTPAVAIGEHITLQIAAVLEGGYNFSLPSGDNPAPAPKIARRR
jgi:hypothetical protein